ncbi:MAG: C4-dicarboxylate ABC transporter [Betaproteobacteria bacterium SG8_40]|nr:MAG: C4-dicarboxylate ABC transporter [Betaproteobacteria bacterium SG8_40]
MRPIILLAVAALAAGLTACSESNTQELKIHHLMPPRAPTHTKLIVPWCKKIEKESDGELKCRIYPAMQLGGSPTQLYDQVKDGVVDIIWTVPGYSAGRFPSIEVFELPFMMQDTEATSKALWDYVAENKLGEFDDVHLLAMHVHGPGYFHMVDKPGTSRADLQGLKIRAPTRQTNKFIEQLGATPVGMPIPQVPEALAKGVIDGTIVPYEIVPAIKADELTRFHSETPSSEPAIYTTTLLFAMNKARYEGLSAKQKEVLDANSGVELSGLAGRIFGEADVAGKATLDPDSINVIPPEEIEEWKKLAQPVITGWVDEMDGRGADGNALLNSARRLTQKYNP